MASGVALADQFAAKHGQRPLGFLNPLLYELGAAGKTRREVFRDVTRGNDDLGTLLPKEVGGGHPLLAAVERGQVTTGRAAGAP